MLQWFRHSVQFLLLRQAVGNPLRTDFPVLHILGIDGVSGAVTNSQHGPNVFRRPSSIVSDDSILRGNNRRGNDDEAVLADCCLSRIPDILDIIFSTLTHAHVTYCFSPCTADIRGWISLSCSPSAIKKALHPTVTFSRPQSLCRMQHDSLTTLQARLTDKWKSGER